MAEARLGLPFFPLWKGKPGTRREEAQTSSLFPRFTNPDKMGGRSALALVVFCVLQLPYQVSLRVMRGCVPTGLWHSTTQKVGGPFPGAQRRSPFQLWGWWGMGNARGEASVLLPREKRAQNRFLARSHEKLPRSREGKRGSSDSLSIPGTVIHSGHVLSSAPFSLPSTPPPVGAFVRCWVGINWAHRHGQFGLGARLGGRLSIMRGGGGGGGGAHRTSAAVRLQRRGGRTFIDPFAPPLRGDPGAAPEQPSLLQPLTVRHYLSPPPWPFSAGLDLRRLRAEATGVCQ